MPSEAAIRAAARIDERCVFGEPMNHEVAAIIDSELGAERAAARALKEALEDIRGLSIWNGWETYPTVKRSQARAKQALAAAEKAGI